MWTVRRYVGETRRLVWTVTVDGVAPDITSWLFTLTVNETLNPTDQTDEVDSVTGTIIDGPNGQVAFDPTADMVATVGRFFFDIQMTDDLANESTLKGEWLVVGQDITK